MEVDLEVWGRNLSRTSSDDLPEGIVSPAILFVGRLAVIGLGLLLPGGGLPADLTAVNRKLLGGWTQGLR